jgi:pilus assembly protein CpaF
MSSQRLADSVFTLDTLDQDVRAEIRRRGVDPLTDVESVRAFARSAVSAHDQRSLTGIVRPMEDPERAVDDLVNRVSGFGPLQPYLDDPSVEEIWVNEPHRVFVARDGRHELTTTILTDDEVRDLVERMLKTSGRRLDVSSPFVDAMLPSGHRLHVVLAGIVRGFVAVNIRKFVVKANRLKDLVELGTLTPAAARFLDACVVAGLNIIVSGGTQAGKTTMLNTLGSAVPGRERIVSAEEVYELRFSHPDWVPMQTRQSGLEGTGEIRLRRLVKEALRMRPSRIVVGEVRAEECLDLLLALNSGLPGMATIHANSAREALVKLCTLPLLAGENISARFVVPTVAASIDIVVQLGIDADGRRRVREIVAVPGRVESDIIEAETIFSTEQGRLVRAQGMPPRLESFASCGIDIHGLLAQHGEEPRLVDRRPAPRTSVES